MAPSKKKAPAPKKAPAKSKISKKRSETIAHSFENIKKAGMINVISRLTVADLKHILLKSPKVQEMKKASIISALKRTRSEEVYKIYVCAVQKLNE